MADYITLSCPSCGAKLEVSEDIGQFACAHCGQEHILYQAGGIVALKPLIEGMKNIEAAVDDVSVDLAINRLYFEIEELVRKKRKILVKNPKPVIDTHAGIFFAGIIVIILLMMLFWKILLEVQIFSFSLSGVICLILGFFMFMGETYMLDKKVEKDKNNWDVTIGFEVNELDEQIKAKKAAIQQLKHDEAFVNH